MSDETINGGAPAKQNPTEYVILTTSGRPTADDTPLFSVVGGIHDGKPATFPGVTKQAAIKLADPGPGTYIAVPARTFQPIKLEVEERPQTKFGTGTL